MRLLWALFALPWSVACLTMFICFHTWQGKGFALWAGLLLAAWGSAAWRRPATLPLALAALAGLLGLSLHVFQRPSAGVGYYVPGFDWMRWNPANLIPESDLAELGVRLIYPPTRSQQVLATIRPLYADMQAFHGLPHVIPYTAADLFGGPSGAGHFYYYLPPSREKVPVLIFLHGAMGNFQSFLRHWQRWAESRGWAVVCPTFGYGSWYHPGGTEAAVEALRVTLATLPVDPDRVALAALSNGSTGAVRLIRQRPQNVRWLLLASPVMEDDQYTSPEFLEWATIHPPPLILEGEEDVNVSPEAVKGHVAVLEKAGVKCDLRLIPGHDHHMLFSAGPAVYAALDQLLQK